MSKTNSLLVEILTEELPPKALKDLSDAFASKLFFDLQKWNFLTDSAAVHAFATPRRLAALITNVQERSPDNEREVQGPSTGAPQQAVAGFAKKSGIGVEALKKQQTAKGEVYVARVKTPGRALDEVLAEHVAGAIKALPVPKIMRWGAGDAQFVRPVHGLVMMHGTRVVPGMVLGISSSSKTSGHRFMSAGFIQLKNADEYEARLLNEGMVIADFHSRRAVIESQLQTESKRLGAELYDYSDLLDEVTAIVEHPKVYVGTFDRSFLEIPQECLVLTMRQNQKYFPLVDSGGILQPTFLIVSNTETADPRHIIRGNERVVSPRLQDARFFYNQDRKIRLETRVQQLAKVVYHNKLGSQLQRVQRLQLLSGQIARDLKADAALAERAAWLAKADLLTNMVGEFPELQGIMGQYYARHDGEPPSVANAIEDHYTPRFAGDRLPRDLIGCSVALADKCDSLVGIFAVEGQPKGDKDPFGLRRQALGVVRILMETPLAIDLQHLLKWAVSGFSDIKIGEDVVESVRAFIIERLRHYESLRNTFRPEEIEAIVSKNPSRLDTVINRLAAVSDFRGLPEALALAEANKRINNILRKADYKSAAPKPDLSLAKEPAEKVLISVVQKLGQDVHSGLAQGQSSSSFVNALKALAQVNQPLAKFFDEVMVMTDDARLRENRLATLARLFSLMNEVADISKLSK